MQARRETRRAPAPGLPRDGSKIQALPPDPHEDPEDHPDLSQGRGDELEGAWSTSGREMRLSRIRSTSLRVESGRPEHPAQVERDAPAFGHPARSEGPRLPGLQRTSRGDPEVEKRRKTSIMKTHSYVQGEREAPATPSRPPPPHPPAINPLTRRDHLPDTARHAPKALFVDAVVEGCRCGCTSEVRLPRPTPSTNKREGAAEGDGRIPPTNGFFPNLRAEGGRHYIRPGAMSKTESRFYFWSGLARTRRIRCPNCPTGSRGRCSPPARQCSPQ